MSALTVDPGSGSSNPNSATFAGSNTTNVVMGFANPSLIVVFIFIENPSSAPSVSSLSGGGLTWNLRKTEDWSSSVVSSHFHIEEWWAWSASAQSSITITAALAATYDGGTITAVAINGVVNTSDPYDTSASFPTFSTVGAIATQPSATITTTFTDDFVLAFWCTGSNQSVPSADTTNNWIGLGSINSSAPPVNWAKCSTEGQAFAAVQTGLTVDFVGTPEDYGLFIDVLTGGSGGAAPSGAPILLLLGV